MERLLVVSETFEVAGDGAVNIGFNNDSLSSKRFFFNFDFVLAGGSLCKEFFVALRSSI